MRRDRPTTEDKRNETDYLVLIVLGALALAYQGFNYSRTEKVLEMGPLHVTHETQKRIPLPPIVGGLALVGGVVLFVVGGRRGVQ